MNDQLGGPLSDLMVQMAQAVCELIVGIFTVIPF